MADNVVFQTSALATIPDAEIVATKEVTFSGDAGSEVQLIELVAVTGTEGSRTLTEITDGDGVWVQGSIAHDAIDSGNPLLLGGHANAAAPTNVAENDRVRTWHDLAGRIMIDSDQTLVVDGSAVTQPVSGTVTADAGTGTFATSNTVVDGWDNEASDGASVSGNVLHDSPDGTTEPIKVGGRANAAAPTNSAENDRVNSWHDLAGRQMVGALNDGSLVVRIGDGSVLADVDNASLQITGDEAHDAPDAGSPVKIGAKAVGHSAITGVAVNDRTDIISNRDGVQFVIGGHPNIISREYRATTAQTNDDIVGAIAGGLQLVITKIGVFVDNACTVDVGVRIGFGTTTVPTEPADGAGVNGVVLSHPGIAPGSGVELGDGSAIIAHGASDQELRITNEVPTGGSIKVVITYFDIETP